MKRTKRTNSQKRAFTHSKKIRGYLLENTYEALLSAIRGGDFRPGERLFESEICDWLHVSRTPVREALRRLQAQGLLEHEPGGGVSVSLHDFPGVTQLYVYGEMLEGFAARLASQNAGQTEIDLLTSLVRIQQTLPPDPSIHQRQNKTFHKHLYQATHNKFLAISLHSLLESVCLLGGTTLSAPSRLEVSIREHDEIVTAITARDCERADALARQHIRNSYRAQIVLVTEELRGAALKRSNLERHRLRC